MISHIGTKATLAPQDLYPDHTHHCFEITYIHEGCGFMHTANGDMPFEKNSFYIIPPNAIHSLVSANGHIATSMLTRNERLSSIRDVMWARDVDNHELESIIKIMVEHRSDLGEFLQYLGKAVVLIMLDLIGIDELEQARSKAVEQIITKINRHFSDPEFKVKTALEESPYAEDYIREIFKAQTGLTPMQMLSEVRLKHAENIMLYSLSERSISNIALESGFDDLAYFSKVFKKRFGMSPAEYKKKNGKL
ncbi:MAG: helix-turn-helix domain-containing protein [Ruminococcaceae bacterium]|nr:helix-turn-helix domain-containing protein [Oscillospiraceae bacterium]